MKGNCNTVGKTARDKANEEGLILYGEEMGRGSITEEITLNLGSKDEQNFARRRGQGRTFQADGREHASVLGENWIIQQGKNSARV